MYNIPHNSNSLSVTRKTLKENSMQLAKRLIVEDSLSDVNPRKSMGLCVKFIKIGGLRATNNMPYREAIMYKVFKSFVVFLFATISIGIYGHLFVSWGDLEAFLETTTICISFAVFSFKLHVMLSRDEEVEHIIVTAQENFYIHGKELSTENRQIIKGNINLARTITIIYGTTVTCFFALYNIFGPLLSTANSLETQNVTNISSGAHISDRKFPIEIWYPVDVTQSPNYEIAYVLHQISGFFNLWNFMTIDVFCITSIIYVTGQFELLCDSLRHASERVKYRLINENEDSSGDNKECTRDRSKKEEPNTTAESNYTQALAGLNVGPFASAATDEDDTIGCLANQGLLISHSESSFPPLHKQLGMEQYLVECIKHHQKLLAFAEKLDILWTTVFFVQFLTASILICFLGFQATSMEININFMKMVGYLVCVILQLGLYCAFGSKLMTQSEAVYNAVYDSDWYNQSERYKYYTRMMIMRAQRPVKLTAGRFGTLSLPLFASMLQSSYSYLALLRQMQEDQ